MTLRRVAVAFAAAGLVAITGCGSSSADGSNSQSSGDLTLASFASATRDAQLQAKSAHLEMQMNAKGQKVTLTGDMAIGASLDRTSFQVEMDAPSLGSGVSMILVEKVIYLDAGRPTDNKYVSIDLTDDSNPLGAMYGRIFAQSNPAGIIKSFKGAIDHFEAVGSEQIDGTPTTQYRVTVDTREVLAKMLGKDTLSAAKSGLGNLPKTMTYDIWVGDDDDLPRRIEYSAMGSSLTMNLSKWGEPVDIQAPPKSQISDKDPFGQMSMS